MVSPIGTAYPPSAAGVGEPGLQVQLDKARKELADCVGCASARTSQGQEAIRRASDKVARLEARLERTRQDEQAALPPSADAGPKEAPARLEPGRGIDVYA